ncbi:MAG: membrane protein insertase YidC, partial [Polaribacter sp.]
MEQKKFDYNSLIGMILLAGIFLYWMSTQKPETAPEKNTTEQVVDSIKTTTNQHTIPKETPVVLNDSLQQEAAKNKLGAFAYSAVNGKPATKVLENELLKLTIDTKGGQIVEALIKNYTTYDSLPLYMVKDKNASFNINFGTTD